MEPNSRRDGRTEASALSANGCPRLWGIRVRSPLSKDLVDQSRPVLHDLPQVGGHRRPLKSAAIDLSRARILDLGAGGEVTARASAIWACRAITCSRSISWRSAPGAPGKIIPGSDFSWRRDPSSRFGIPGSTLSIVNDAVLRPGSEHRARIFAEVRRVLVAGGVFLSYDTRYPSPRNRNTRPLRARELVQAFGLAHDSEKPHAIASARATSAPFSLRPAGHSRLFRH